jgi:hypothetical protein
MAYADIGDVVSGNVITETWGDQVRANFQAGVPDIFTTKGDLAAATAADTAARLGIGADDAMLVPDAGETTGLAWQIRPTCRLYNSGAFTVTSGDWRSVTWDSESWDSNSLHSTSTNTDRITIPTGGAGLYLFGGVARWVTTGYSPVDTGQALGLRLVNTATVVATDYRSEMKADIWGVDEDVFVTFGPWLASVAAADYLYLQARTRNTLNLAAADTHIWCVYQRRAP